MKSFGRLLMAAALIVPAAGFVATQSAGAAATPDNVVCTTNTGTIHFNPGMSLTTKHGSTVTTAVDGTLDSCTGVGIVDSTGAALRFSVRSAPVTCKTIKGATLTGKGTVRWNSGDTDSHRSRGRILTDRSRLGKVQSRRPRSAMLECMEYDP